MFRELGIVPVVWSSEGSRVSIRMYDFWGALMWDLIYKKLITSYEMTKKTYVVERVDLARFCGRELLRVGSEL